MRPPAVISSILCRTDLAPSPQLRSLTSQLFSRPEHGCWRLCRHCRKSRPQSQPGKMSFARVPALTRYLGTHGHVPNRCDQGAPTCPLTALTKSAHEKKTNSSSPDAYADHQLEHGIQGHDRGHSTDCHGRGHPEALERNVQCRCRSWYVTETFSALFPSFPPLALPMRS